MQHFFVVFFKFLTFTMVRCVPPASFFFSFFLVLFFPAGCFPCAGGKSERSVPGNENAAVLGLGQTRSLLPKSSFSLACCLCSFQQSHDVAHSKPP